MCNNGLWRYVVKLCFAIESSNGRHTLCSTPPNQPRPGLSQTSVRVSPKRNIAGEKKNKNVCRLCAFE